MDEALLGLIGAVVGAAVGAAASIATTVLTHRQEGRKAERTARQQRRNKAAGFQVESLLGLQQAANDFMDACRPAVEYRRRTTGAPPAPPVLLTPISLATGKVLLFKERVLDDQVRAEIEDYLMLSTEAATNPDWEAAEQAEVRVTSTWMRAHRRMGEALRDLYEPITLPESDSSPAAPPTPEP